MLLPLRRFLRRLNASFCRRRFSSLSALDPLEPITPSHLEHLILSHRRGGGGGKFHSLFYVAVANPSVLAAACLRLASLANFPALDISALSTSQRHLVEHLADELTSNRFDARSHCVKLVPSRKKGQWFFMANLKLKVVIESVRMVLDVVYDKKFATFAYGGRSGLGRHTAVRYLKSNVKNPTWWFRVKLQRQRFDFEHLSRLVSMIEEKIEDSEFIDLVKQLFESHSVMFDFGGLDLGRGLPQESILVPLLVNIYFDGLDRVIQDIRADVHKRNPRIDSLKNENNPIPNVFHNPVRIYAVRYLDEVLVVTSGAKTLTISVKDKILNYLESELKLKVDKFDSSIHSAVSEKVSFMGMELQAVPPSVLHPPMSEKAIRARKKYLKSKLAKVQELKNARETIRKKLGLKIFNHVFRKLKRGVTFKFDFNIVKELDEIFRSWGEEVVSEFFKSRDDRWAWHRMLSSGDFLSLKRIRDQLPSQLVDAYDEFQESVDKFLMPVRASEVIREEERREEEEHETKYAKETVEDLSELHARFNAPMELVKKAVKLAKFTNSMGRPRPIKLLICLDDVDIVKWYSGVGRRFLDFFCCCSNFKTVKKVVNYHLRFSCFLTLAEKHESTKREAIRHYTKELKVTDEDGRDEIYFPTEREIRMMGDKCLSDPLPVDGALCLMLVRLASKEHFGTCSAHFCECNDTILYRIRLLQNRLNVDPLDDKKWVQGMGSIHESLNRKCLPLCPKHVSHLLLGKISLQDVDCTSFIEIE